MTHEQKAPSAARPFFTIVFHGDVRAIKSNPLFMKSGFGDVAIVSDGNIVADRDALATERDGLKAENERLRATLEFARQLLECIEQTPNNVWYVNADDPESAVIETYSIVEKALRAQAGGG